MPRTRALSAVLVFLVLLSVPCVSLADDVTWTLSNVTLNGPVTLNDGATVSGFFVYNADTNTVISADIVTTMTSVFAGATYTAADPNFGLQDATQISFVPNPNLSDFTGTPMLNLVFATALTDAGGTVTLMPEANNSNETTCLDPFCGNGNFPPLRWVTAGVVTTQQVSTPEPSALLLLGMGLLSFLGGAKRRMAA